MSLTKGATTRRLSLLAGSSLVAASLTALSGLALAPTAAMAQVNCTSPAAPAGNNTTAVTIAAGTYNPGITCSYTGTVSTIATAGAITVSSTAGGDGVNLSAAGSGTVNWNSTAGGVTGGAQTNGPVIDARSVSGAISVTTAGVTATAAGTTYGIRAVSGDATTSTPGGNITITRTVNGAVNNNVAGGQAAIYADTNGGNINITTLGNTNGRLRGILAKTSGAGSVTMTIGGATNANAIDGIAAIDVVAGTGGVNITTASNTVNAGAGGLGFAIRAVTTGSAVINNTGSTIGQVSFNLPAGGGAVDFSGVAGGVTFSHGGATNVSGRWLASGASVFSAANDTLNMTGIGRNYIGAGASINFGAGNDTFNMGALFNMGAFTDPNTASLDFGSGTDTFNMSGVFSTSGGVISNLEAFNNSGLIYIGAAQTQELQPHVDFEQSNASPDDVFVLTGVTYTGSGSGRIVFDVLLDGSEQAGCDAMTGAADCFDLRGSTTAGVTLVTLNNIGDDAEPGLYMTGGATLVDVEGGTSAAGHFVLDPNTDGYIVDPAFGGVIQRPGLFNYALRYDPDGQRHVLVGLPRGEVFEYAMLAGAAQSIWHMTTETVTDRQTDLRAGAGNTVWVRASGEYTQRDVATAFESFGEAFAFDNSYKLYAGTVMAGRDFIVGRSGDYDYALGAQIGYVGSSFDLTEAGSSGRFSGATGGVYASVWSGGAFLDAALNANGLTLDYESGGLGSKTNTYLNSIGGEVEGGLRIGLTERSFVEPLATVAYVRTSFEEISLDGGEIIPGDAESLRAALGARVGATLGGGGVNVSWFVAGRAWNEFEGSSGGIVNNPGVDLPFSDEFSGGFGEAEAGINIFNDAGTMSGFLTSGVKMKSGYSAVNLALGTRMVW